MKRHPITLSRKIIQSLLVFAMALSTTPVTPMEASPQTVLADASAALAPLTPALASANDPNTVVVSAVGQIAPGTVQARVGQTVTFANNDSLTRYLRLDGVPVDGLPNRAFLPIVVRGGGALSSPARPATPADVRNITLLAGQSRVFTFTRAGNVTVTDVGFVNATALILVMPETLSGEGNARGVVRSYLTKLGIPGAHVKTLDGAHETIADASGQYTLSLPAGEYTLAMFANGFTFANRKARVEAFTPMQVGVVDLVPLDPNVAPIGAAGGAVINSTGETSATFASGAVSTTKAIRLTVLPTNEFAGGGDYSALPGPFTEGDIPLAFVMFEPDGTHFDGPVNWQNLYTGSLPIGTNWTNGLYCDYWLEAEARWGEPEPAEVIAGPGGSKILSTTLPHFSAYGYRIGPPPTAGGMPITLTAAPGSAAGPDTNRPKDNPKCPNGKCPKGSGVNLLDGELTQEIDTLGLPSAGGMATAVGATYHSRDAGAPGAVVSVTLPVAQYGLPPDRAEWQFDVAGRVFTGTGRNVDVHWDGRDAGGALMPPGRHEGQLTSIYKFNSPTGWSNFTTVISWPVQLSRADFSPWGLGWFGAHDTLLLNRGLAVTIQQADGRQLNFVKTLTGYLSPNSDFSTLTRAGDGTWTRSFQDGSTMRFNADGRLERVTDRFGNFQVWYYEANGATPPAGGWALTTRIRRVQDTSGNTFEYAYTAAGWLNTITDSAGRAYGLTHDAAGNLTSLTYPDGSAESYGYDGRNLMTSHTDARGNQTLYGLDDDGQILTRTWPTGSQLQVSRVTTRTVVTLDSGTKITTVLDGRYNPAASQNGAYSVTYTTSPRNQTNTASNRPGLTLYDDNGNPIAAYDAAVTLLERGGPYNQVSGISRSNGNDAQFGFDALGNVNVITNALGYATRFTTNGQGLRASAQDALGNTTTNTYSARGQLTRTVDPLGNSATISYTPFGGVQSLTDPLGHITRQEQDALLRTTAITDALNGVTRLTYDPQGNPTRLTDPSGRVLSRTYDVLNRPIAVQYPDGGIERFGYDLDGALTVYTDTRGVRTDFVTDAANRLAGSNVQGGRRITSTYDAQDQLVGVTDGVISSTMTFLGGESGFLTQVKRTPVTGLPLTSTLDLDYGQSGDAIPQTSLTPRVHTPVALPVITPRVHTSPALPVVTPTLGNLAALSATMPIVNVCGVVSSDTVFSAGSVYRVTCDVTVNAGVTLTIQPGTVVKLNSTTSIFVDGALIAVGSLSQPIAITSQRDDTLGGDSNGDGVLTQPGAGDWYSIRVRNNGTAELRQTTVRFGGGAGLGQFTSEGSARVSIADSVLSNSSANGVYADNASLDLRSSTLISNAQRSLFVAGLQSGQRITVEANTFAGNLTVGAGYLNWNGNPDSIVISGNVGGGKLSVFELYGPGVPIQVPLIWDNPGIALVLNQATIGVTGVLTLSAGSVMKQGIYDAFVDGRFVADGRPDAPVFITSMKDDSVGGDSNGDGGATQPAAGDWYAIRIRNTGMAELRQTTLRFGGGNGLGQFTSEGSARVSIADSVLSNSSANGVYAGNGSLDLRNSTLISNAQRSLFVAGVQPGQRITVASNTFAGNLTVGAGYLNWNGNLDSIVISGNVGGGKLSIFELYGAGAPIQLPLIWDNPGIALYLNQATIGVTGVLTLSAGSVLKQGSSDAFVDGRLVADGRQDAPVFITSMKDDSVGGDSNGDGAASQPAPADWTGIRVRNNGAAELRQTTLRFGGGNGFGQFSSEGSARVSIADSVLSNSYGQGVYVGTGSLDLSSSTLISNAQRSLYVAGLQPGQRITVASNTFAGNLTVGAGYLNWNGNPDSIVISGNVGGGKLSVFELYGPGAPIQVPLTWNNPGIALYLNQATIGVTGVLTLSAGSVIKTKDYDLVVDGRFVAEGTADAPVFITSMKDDSVGGDSNGDGAATQPAAGDWYSLIARNSGSVRFRYATLRYGSAALLSAVNNARVSIADSTFSNAIYDGISLDNAASVVISQSNFIGTFRNALFTRSTLPVTATLNYWGAPSGPQHTSNPAGTGALVTSILLPPTYRTGDVALLPFMGSRLLPGGGRLVSARFASAPAYSQTLRYRYDVLGRLTRQQNTGYGDYTLDLGYDPVNRLTSRVVRGAATLDLGYGFDGASRVISLTAAGAAGALLSESYGYDANGNLTRTISSRDGVDGMTYDALSRISSFNGVNYAYDPAGNRTQAGAVTFGYDAGGRVTSASDGRTYAYDAAGNLAGKTNGSGTTTYTWDAEAHLARIDYPDASYSQYGYDEQGRRISKRTPDGVTIFFVYAGDRLMQELDASGNVLAAYSYDGLDKPVTMWRGGQTYAYVRNALGSVLGLVDASGAWAAAYRYDAWGNLISSTEMISNPLRFTAREWDGESGLYFYRARYYDPAVGRFISRDPIGAKGGMNPYAYVGNRPMSARDPSGLVFCNMFGCFRFLWEADAATKQPEPKASVHANKTKAAKPELAPPMLDPNAPCPLAPRGGDLIGQDGGGLIGNDGGGLVGDDGASLVGDDGASLISNDGGGIVASGGGNIVATGGGN